MLTQISVAVIFRGVDASKRHRVVLPGILLKSVIKK